VKQKRSDSVITISNRQKYNLNEMAHESTIGLIRGVLELGINITEVSQLVLCCMYDVVRGNSALIRYAI
jgi:hypothetical protein